jgi:hypothetical protein
MNIRRFLATTLLLLAATQPVLAQTPVNHLISVLQASTQELQAAAQLSSAQQAYSVVTQIVNQIFKAMQQMSLPYYQNQLQFLTNQQISLSNRLAALQTNISSNANMLFRMTGAVSSSLAAQTANLGSIVVLYQNTVNPKVNQLVNQIAGLSSVIPDASSEAEQFATSLAELQSLAANFDHGLQQITNNLQLYIPNLLLYWSTTIDVPSNLPVATDSKCVVMNVNFNRHYDVVPSVQVFSYALTSSPKLALNPVVINITEDLVTLWLCDRTGPSYTFIPTRLYIEVEDAFAI